MRIMSLMWRFIVHVLQIDVRNSDDCLFFRIYLQFAATGPISTLSFGTMNINALVINGSDPGAVPGDSTNTSCLQEGLHLGLMGSKQDRRTPKGVSFVSAVCHRYRRKRKPAVIPTLFLKPIRLFRPIRRNARRDRARHLCAIRIHSPRQCGPPFPSRKDQPSRPRPCPCPQKRPKM